MAHVVREEGQHDPTDVRAQVMLHKLDAGVWGLFFVWIGIALLAGFAWGVGLIGVGILVLAGQFARRYFSLGFERFWILAGALFLLGGLWELFSIRVGLVPILCIVVGVALLTSALIDNPKISKISRNGIV